MTGIENRTEICRELLYDFLDKWTLENVKQMTLEQYVSLRNPETFVQWLETKTKIIGNIKGISSFIYGIYKRMDTTKLPKTMYNDSHYSWRKVYGKSRNGAYNEIKKEILDIIQFSDKGEFEKIDSLRHHQFYKWKIACLYSNERLIPIFKSEVLLRIANHFGLKANSKTPISKIQRLMIEKKPAHLSIYEYSEMLYDKFGNEKKKNEKLGDKRTTRKSTAVKNTSTQSRRGAASYVATQKHNILQEALKKKLIAKYGKKNVLLENNFVDIKVIQPEKLLFYEVKSSAYASDCIREALGQILSYTHRDKDKRPKKIIIAGQYKPNQDEISYIKYVKENIKLNIDYESIDID